MAEGKSVAASSGVGGGTLHVMSSIEIGGMNNSISVLLFGVWVIRRKEEGTRHPVK